MRVLKRKTQKNASKTSRYRDSRPKWLVDELKTKAEARRKRRNAKRLENWTGKRA